MKQMNMKCMKMDEKYMLNEYLNIKNKREKVTNYIIYVTYLTDRE